MQNKLIKRFELIFGDDYNQFKNIMEKSDAICSGSFTIQCLLDEDWRTDIDIYLPLSGLTSPSGNPTSCLDTWLLETGAKMDSYYAANRYGDNMSKGNCITWIRNFTYKTYKFQLIHTNLGFDNLDGYIVENFDFSICKNRFSVKNGIEELQIEDYAGILKRSFNFNYAGNIISSLKRKRKYEALGFKCYLQSSSREILDTIKEYCAVDNDNKRVQVFETSKDIDDINHIRDQIFPYEAKVNKMDETEVNRIISDCRGEGPRKKWRSVVTCSDCIFTHLGFVHFHTDGSHIGHGACKDLVIISTK